MKNRILMILLSLTMITMIGNATITPITYEYQSGKVTEYSTMQIENNGNNVNLTQLELIGKQIAIYAEHTSIAGWDVTLIEQNGYIWITKGKDNKIYYINSNYIQAFYVN